MNIIWALILSSLAGFSTVLGSLFTFINTNKKDEFITFSISFSLAVMLSISIFDLIPSALPNISQNIIKSIIVFSIFFCIGIILVNIINKMIEKEKGSTNNLYKIGILSFIALILHNFPEGILTFLSTYKDFKLGLPICIAIAMHNIPEGISIAVPIYYSTKSRRKAFRMTFVSGFAEPLGAILAYIILKDYITNEIISIFLILVSGIMISLSINKMLPEALSYQKKKPLYMGFIMGILLVLINVIFL